MRVVFLSFIAMLLALSPVIAQDNAVQPYYNVSDFLETTPSVEGGAIGGMFNPAVLGLNKFELATYWSDAKKTSGQDRRWTLAADAGGLGFSMQQLKYFNPPFTIPTDGIITDYQLGLGFGDRSSRFGVSYGWSKGDITTTRPRSNVLTFGTLSRPIKQISYGIAATTSTKDGDWRGIADVGIRPFGTPLLTVFGDAAIEKGDDFEDILWSAGAAVEPLSGIAINFKTYAGGSYMMGLSLTTSGTRYSGSSRYSKGGSLVNSPFGIVAGLPKKDNFLDKAFMKMMPKKIRGMQFAKLDLNDGLKYQRYEFFDTKGQTLMELLEDLEAVKEDPMVGGLVVRITEEFHGSWEMIWEVREKMLEVKSAGKTIVVFLERGGQQAYYIASTADKIMVDPETSVAMYGFAMGRSFYKNLLEKVGVGFDEWRFFTYKSAMESFSREKMSEADKTQRTELIEGWYEVFRADVSASRNITHEQFDHIVDEVVVLDADSLIFYKLADTTGRWDDMEDYLKFVTGSKKSMTSFASINMRKPISRLWGEPPEIALIYALGPCSMNDGINARRLQKVIKKARENKNIKAVVFRADSPGGDILPSDIVAEELKKTAAKKPVIISQGQVAASGGYWISMYGDKIVASPWTVTGSIGVIGGWFYDNGLNNKFGTTVDWTNIGKHSDLLVAGELPIPLVSIGFPHRNLNGEERVIMEKHIRLSYDGFITKVAAGRKMDKDSVNAIGQGRVWTGVAGKANGLVDELGGIETALKLAKEKAKITAKDEAEVVEMPKKGPIDLGMFQPKLLGIRVSDLENDPEVAYIRTLVTSKGRPFAMLPPDLMP